MSDQHHDPNAQMDLDITKIRQCLKTSLHQAKAGDIANGTGEEVISRAFETACAAGNKAES